MIVTVSFNIGSSVRHFTLHLMMNGHCKTNIFMIEKCSINQSDVSSFIEPKVFSYIKIMQIDILLKLVSI